MKPIVLAFLVIFVATGYVSESTQNKESLDYLGQKPPGNIPVKFAAGLVSLPYQNEFGSIFSGNADEFFYAVDIAGKADIRFTKRSKNKWTKPMTLIVDEKFSYNDPFLSPDENKLYFISERPLITNEKKKDYDIWYVQRKGNDWSAPINAGAAINSNKNEYYISFSKNGTMYFSSNRNAAENGIDNFDIYYSTIKNGKYQIPANIGKPVNTPNYEADVFIAYDESYLIFCRDNPQGLGKRDLYISFKKKDDTWTNAKNMGKSINTSGHELCPFVSKDGKYFFFTSNEDIYWVSAQIIEEFREL